jgi:hypothetical protein
LPTVALSVVDDGQIEPDEVEPANYQANFSSFGIPSVKGGDFSFA